MKHFKAEEFIPDPDSINPQWSHIFGRVDVKPKYDIDSPYPVDNTVYSPRSNYRGNKKLKRAGVETEITEEMEEEFARCADDILYFAERYFFIRTLDDGTIKIPLYDFQKIWLRISEMPDVRFRQWLAARQTSKSTTITIEILHSVIFNEGFEVGIVAQAPGTAAEILKRVRTAYELLPRWMQIGVEEWQKGSFVLENKSNVFFASALSDKLRGKSLNHVLVDEAAFVKDMDGFFTATFPTISRSKVAKFTIISTPNGRRGYFYDNWVKATKGKNDFFTFMVKWYHVPEEDDFKEKEMARVGALRFRQERNCEFIGSSDSLINPLIIEKIESLCYDPIEVTDYGEHIFEKYIDGHTYISVVDCGEGKNQDYSAMITIDVSVFPFKIVSVFRNNDVSQLLFPAHIYKIGMSYGESLVLIENNSVGSVVGHILHTDIEYGNIYFSDPTKLESLGVRQTAKTKRIGCSNLKTIIENDKLEIPFELLVKELNTFEESGNSYAAADGCHDDMVMCLVIFSWYSTQDEFKEYYSTGSLAKEIYEEEIGEIVSFAENTSDNDSPNNESFW